MSPDTVVARTTPSEAPWTVTDRREKLHVGGSLFMPASFHFVVSNKEFDVAAIFGDGFANRGLAEANARLVAAAPDLLNIVKMAAEYVEDAKYRFIDHWNDDDAESYNNLFAAIDAVLENIGPPAPQPLRSGYVIEQQEPPCVCGADACTVLTSDFYGADTFDDLTEGMTAGMCSQYSDLTEGRCHKCERKCEYRCCFVVMSGASGEKTSTDKQKGANYL